MRLVDVCRYQCQYQEHTKYVSETRKLWNEPESKSYGFWLWHIVCSIVVLSIKAQKWLKKYVMA